MRGGDAALSHIVTLIAGISRFLLTTPHHIEETDAGLDRPLYPGNTRSPAVAAGPRERAVS